MLLLPKAEKCPKESWVDGTSVRRSFGRGQQPPEATGLGQLQTSQTRSHILTLSPDTTPENRAGPAAWDTRPSVWQSVALWDLDS